MLRYRAYYVAALALVFLILGAAACVYARHAGTLAERVADAAACFTGVPTTTGMSCAQARISSLLHDYDSHAIFAQMAATMPPGACHILGHVVGMEVYARSHASLELAVSRCDRGCFDACLHGAVAGAFMASLPPNTFDASEMQHPSLETVRNSAAQFCTTRQGCHAIGHVLLDITSSLSQALALCDSFAGTQAWTCYRGAFMENNLPESSRFLPSPAGTSAIDTGSDDLFALCNQIPSRYMPVCLTVLYRTQETLFSQRDISDPLEEFHLRRDACLTLAPAMQPYCFEGVGESFVVFHPLSDARAACAGLAAHDNRVACIFGLAHTLSDYDQDAFPTCAALSDEDAAVGCYRAIIDSRHGRNYPDAATVCDRTVDDRCALAQEIARTGSHAYIRLRGE